MRRVSLKQPARKVTYKNGPWDGQTGMLRGSQTLTFSIANGESGSYRDSETSKHGMPTFQWIPKTSSALSTK